MADPYPELCKHFPLGVIFLYPSFSDFSDWFQPIAENYLSNSDIIFLAPLKDTPNYRKWIWPIVRHREQHLVDPLGEIAFEFFQTKLKMKFSLIYLVREMVEQRDII